MNTKRCLLAFIAVWVFIFLFEWVFHGILLQSFYAESAYLWRPKADMMQRFHYLVIGQGFIALGLVLLVTKFAAGLGPVGGAKVGIFLAIVHVGVNCITYAVQPVSSKLVVIWDVGGLIEFALAGLIAGAIYRLGLPSASAAPSTGAPGVTKA